MPIVFLLIRCVVIPRYQQSDPFLDVINRALSQSQLLLCVKFLNVQHALVWLHHYCTHITKLLQTMVGGRSHVPFHLYFKRHVKYVGHAWVNYSLRFHCCLEVEMGDYRNVRALASWNVVAQAPNGTKCLYYTLWNGFCSFGSPSDLDLVRQYQNLMLHYAGRIPMWLLVPHSKAK